MLPALFAALLLTAAGGVFSAARADDATSTPSPTPSADTPAADSAAGGACVTKRTDKDDTIHLRACLRDKRNDGDAPVPGVKLTVTEKGGTETLEGVSDGTGLVDITLGETLDVLGKSYVVKLDEGTLPEGTALLNPDQLQLTLPPVNTEQDQTVAYPIDDAPEQTGTLVQALQLLVGGLVFSSLLALAALGQAVIFGTTGLTNFAHGELVTFGALVGYAFDSLFSPITIGGTNVTIMLGVVAAFVLSGLFGWLNDAALWRPLRRRGTGLIAMMIVSIGLSMFLRNVYQYFAGGSSHLYSQYSNSEPFKIGPISMTTRDLVVFLIAMTLLVISGLLIQRTRIGKATRAVSDNPALASSSGINVERVIRVVWIAGAALAGTAGVLLGITQGFDFQIGFKILLLIFAASVLGGLGSIWGSVVGAFIIGSFVEVSTLWVSPELKYVGALLVLILILLVRPQGLLGRAQRIG